MQPEIKLFDRTRENAFGELEKLMNKAWCKSYDQIVFDYSQSFLRLCLSGEPNFSVGAYDINGNLIGFIGALPRTLLTAKGETIEANIAAFFTVDPDFRENSLAYNLSIINPMMNYYAQRFHDDNGNKGNKATVFFLEGTGKHASINIIKRYLRQRRDKFKELASRDIVQAIKSLDKEVFNAFFEDIVRAIKSLDKEVFNAFFEDNYRYTLAESNQENVRVYRASDLNACYGLVNNFSADNQIIRSWLEQELEQQLSQAQTLVYGQESGVQAFVNYTAIDLYGKKPEDGSPRPKIRSATIEHAYFGKLESDQRVEFMKGVFSKLKDEGYCCVWIDNDRYLTDDEKKQLGIAPNFYQLEMKVVSTLQTSNNIISSKSGICIDVK